MVSKWAPLGSRSTTVAGRGRNQIQEGAEEREPSEVAANARIKVREVICQVRGVICQVERQRAGKSNERPNDGSRPSAYSAAAA